MADGTEHTLRAGTLFAIPPGHDSWVVGDEPYVSLHLLGAADYARGA
jgi:quercetin dioxygenase-like cupin family protein